MTISRRTWALLGLLAITTWGGVATLVTHYLRQLPPLETLTTIAPSLVTRFTDVHGESIAELFTERRTRVPLKSIPVDLQNGIIATEDQNFFRHWGLDPVAILRAAKANLLAMHVVEGGSTITQQLAKVLFLSREKTFARKLKELLLALELERTYSKEEILELYLNQVYFGQGVYGVEAAARTYFGKPVSALTLAESALLAGLPRAPSAYSPTNDAARAQ